MKIRKLLFNFITILTIITFTIPPASFAALRPINTPNILALNDELHGPQPAEVMSAGQAITLIGSILAQIDGSNIAEADREAAKEAIIDLRRGLTGTDETRQRLLGLGADAGLANAWVLQASESVAMDMAGEPTREEAKTALIVEDDPDIAMILKEALEERGYEVTVQRSGEDALGELAAYRPTLVMTDLGLTDGNTGEQVLQAAKSQNIPAILVTGRARDLNATDRTRLEALAEVILSKPFGLGELRGAIESAEAAAPAGPAVAAADADVSFYAQLTAEQRQLVDGMTPDDIVVRNLLAGVIRGGVTRENAIGNISAYLSVVPAGTDRAELQQLVTSWVDRVESEAGADMANVVTLADAYQTALDRIAAAEGLSHVALHQIVRDAVPQEIGRVRQALSLPAILRIVQAERATAAEMTVALDEASQGLTEPEKEFVRLALFGPSQGGLGTRVRDWLKFMVWDVEKYASETLRQTLVNAEFFTALPADQKEAFVSETARLLVENYRSAMDYLLGDFPAYPNVRSDIMSAVISLSSSAQEFHVYLARLDRLAKAMNAAMNAEVKREPLAWYWYSLGIARIKKALSYDNVRLVYHPSEGHMEMVDDGMYATAGGDRRDTWITDSPEWIEIIPVTEGQPTQIAKGEAPASPRDGSAAFLKGALPREAAKRNLPGQIVMVGGEAAVKPTRANQTPAPLLGEFIANVVGQSQGLRDLLANGAAIRIADNLGDGATTTAGGRVVHIDRFLAEELSAGNAPIALLDNIVLKNELTHRLIQPHLQRARTAETDFAIEVLATMEELIGVIGLGAQDRDAIAAWINTLTIDQRARTSIDEFFALADRLRRPGGFYTRAGLTSIALHVAQANRAFAQFADINRRRELPGLILGVLGNIAQQPDIPDVIREKIATAIEINAPPADPMAFVTGRTAAWDQATQNLVPVPENIRDQVATDLGSNTTPIGQLLGKVGGSAATVTGETFQFQEPVDIGTISEDAVRNNASSSSFVLLVGGEGTRMMGQLRKMREAEEADLPQLARSMGIDPETNPEDYAAFVAYATRLKGMLDEEFNMLTKPTVPFIDGKSPLQINLEIIAGLNNRLGAQMPVVLIVSEATRPSVEAILTANNNFGLQNLSIIQQDTNPVVTDATGEFMTINDRLRRSPNGTGGAAEAITQKMDWLRGLNVQNMTILNGDMVTPEDYMMALIGADHEADTVAIGFDFPKDKVQSPDGTSKHKSAFGTFVTITDPFTGESRLTCVEYSERKYHEGLVEAIEAQEQQEGQYVCAIAGAYRFSLDLLDRVTGTLEEHVAPGKDEEMALQTDGSYLKVTKFEKYIPDIVNLSDRPVILKAQSDRFVPLKNPAILIAESRKGEAALAAAAQAGAAGQDFYALLDNDQKEIVDSIITGNGLPSTPAIREILAQIVLGEITNMTDTATARGAVSLLVEAGVAEGVAQTAAHDAQEKGVLDIVKKFTGSQNYVVAREFGGNINPTFMLKDTTTNEITLVEQMVNDTIFRTLDVDRNLQLQRLGIERAAPTGLINEHWLSLNYYGVPGTEGVVSGSQNRLLVGPTGRKWRLYPFLKGEVFSRFSDIPAAERADASRVLGKAMGEFLVITDQVPAEGENVQWGTPLPGFHNHRYHARYLEAMLNGDARYRSLSHGDDTSEAPVGDPARVVGIGNDPESLVKFYGAGAAERVAALAAKYRERIGLTESQALGAFGRAIVHNDTKINNFVFIRDAEGRIAYAVLIDNDTIQEGDRLDDIGDALRSAGNPAGESPASLDDISIDVDVVTGIIDGYVDKLREYAEYRGVPFDAAEVRKQAFEAFKLYCWELGSRFFADAIAVSGTSGQEQPNNYFKLSPDAADYRPDMNLYRGESQMRALEEIEKIEHVAQGLSTGDTLRELSANQAAHGAEIVAPSNEIIIPAEYIDEGYREMVMSGNQSADIKIVPLSDALEMFRTDELEAGRQRIMLLRQEDLDANQDITDKAESRRGHRLLVLQNYDPLHLSTALELARSMASENRESIKEILRILRREEISAVSDEDVEAFATGKVALLKLPPVARILIDDIDKAREEQAHFLVAA